MQHSFSLFCTHSLGLCFGITAFGLSSSADLASDESDESEHDEVLVSEGEELEDVDESALGR